MFNRLRFLWDGLRPPEDALQLGDYDDLPRIELPRAVEERLPERFVAAKLYRNEALGDTHDLARFLEGDLPVVRLEPPAPVDDHVDLDPARPVIDVADLLEPATNLAVQAEIVARAERLVATYGGFSYLGPFTGTPTVALSTRREPNAHHERVLRAVRPNASFERVDL
jgi:hypothetical protein